MASAPPPKLGQVAFIFLACLTFQNGLQSWLTGFFVHQNVIRSTIVINTEILKIIFGLSYLHYNDQLRDILKKWSLKKSLQGAGLPAVTYSVQNIFMVIGYQNLDGLTFNLVNQTKSIACAIFLFFVMGRRQSIQQICALILLFGVGVLVSSDKTSQEKPYDDNMTYNIGITFCLAASLLSGFAASLVQKSQQAVGAVHPLFYSAELAVYSITCLLMGLVFQVVTGKGDGQAIATLGLWQGYDLTTFIPIFTNSIGGLLVGLVVKYAGSINKGYACMMGLVLSGLVKSLIFQLPFSWQSTAAVPLVAFAMWVNLTYPYRRKAKKDSPNNSENPSESTPRKGSAVPRKSTLQKSEV